MTRPILFIDNGGVLNDNSRLIPQWASLTGECMHTIFGGSIDAWTAANHTVLAGALYGDRLLEWAMAGMTYREVFRKYCVDWVNGMCEIVGMPALSEDDCLAMEARIREFVMPRLDAELPGASDAVRTLHNAGFILHTASSVNSEGTRQYLELMGIRECFERLYGSDLVDLYKASPEWYERIFADCGVAPADALVVDDSPKAIAWARKAGARTVLVSADADKSSADLVVPSLATLPSVVHTLD